MTRMKKGLGLVSTIPPMATSWQEEIREGGHRDKRVETEKQESCS